MFSSKGFIVASFTFRSLIKAVRKTNKQTNKKKKKKKKQMAYKGTPKKSSADFSAETRKDVAWYI